MFPIGEMRSLNEPIPLKKPNQSSRRILEKITREPEGAFSDQDVGFPLIGSGKSYEK